MLYEMLVLRAGGKRNLRSVRWGSLPSARAHSRRVYACENRYEFGLQQLLQRVWRTQVLGLPTGMEVIPARTVGATDVRSGWSERMQGNLSNARQDRLASEE